MWIKKYKNIKNSGSDFHKHRFHHNRCKTVIKWKWGEHFHNISSSWLCVSHMFLSHARMRSGIGLQLHVREHVQWRNQNLFQNSPQVFQGAAHTLCKINKSNIIVGLQCSTPRKDVTNRSRSMWQLIFIWQPKSAQPVQATLSTQTLITISSHRIWVWDTTQRKGGKYGNTSGTWRTARSDSGSLDSTTRAS